MAAKILLALLILTIGVLGTHQLWSNYNRKAKMRSGRVIIAVEEAKSKGKTEAHLPATIPLYASVSGLDEALANYTTFLIRPIAQHSQLSADSKEIETWYKLKISEQLSTPKVSSTCIACRSPKDVPNELQGIGNDEFVVVRNSGYLVLDGVTVRSNDSMFPDFEMNREYLLFVSFDANTRMASIELGPKGVSVIAASGVVTPVSEKNRKLTDELVARYGNLKEIKEQLKFRRFPQ